MADDDGKRQLGEVILLPTGAVKLNNKHRSMTRLSQQVKFWQTPKSSDYKRLATSPADHNRHSPDLPCQVLPKRRGILDEAFGPLEKPKTWPTPTATDHKTTSSTQGQTLREKVPNTDGQRLNPQWVEQLMGFPPGWTEPSGTYRGPISPSTTGKRRA
jgi:hypothetical protein